MNTRLFTFAEVEKIVFGALFGWMPWREPLLERPQLGIVAAGSVSPQPFGANGKL